MTGQHLTHLPRILAVKTSRKEPIVRLFAKGDRVAQPQYGSGTVTDANDRHIVIDFDEHGVRRFATSMVKLEPSSQPAPPPKTAARRTRKAAAPKTAPAVEE